MEIKLTIMRRRRTTYESITAPVVHFGRDIPEDKEGITLRGKGIARHHGKIIYAFDSFRYINLTAEPTWILRGKAFSFQLDEVSPQAVVHEGDRLKLGSAIVEITELKPPPPPPKPRSPRPPRPKGDLDCTGINCARCSRVKELGMVQATSDLVHRLSEYAEPDEICRASIDWLYELLEQKAGADLLGNPEAVAIRPAVRAGCTPFLHPEGINRGLSGRAARVQDAQAHDFPAPGIDEGLAFRFNSPDWQFSGVAASIVCYGGSREDRSVAAYLTLRYPSGERPPREAICFAHHAAMHISEALAGVEAARLRRQRELERRGGAESRKLFHDMDGICTGAQGAIGLIRDKPNQEWQALEAKLRQAKQGLDWLMNFIRRGHYAFDLSQAFDLQWLDAETVCHTVLGCLFEDSPSLKQTRDWAVQRAQAEPLPDILADEFCIERAQVFRHYGFIEVASRVGLGTVIGVLFPAPPRPADEQDLEPLMVPYAHHFAETRPIRRWDLEELLRDDEVLRDWYSRPGR
jgi:hypothetical protein